MATQKYAEMIGVWQRLHGRVEANKADLPQLEPFLAKLGTVLAQALEITKRQSAMTAAKQEASKELRKLSGQGNRLASLMRSALKEHYGITEEKLSEFGLQPFRGRARKKESPETPEPPGEQDPPETPSPTAAGPVKTVE
jgi:hypothetical protein